MKDQIKKIIPYLLLAIALVGFLGYEKNAEAQTTNTLGQCAVSGPSIGAVFFEKYTQAQCTNEASKPENRNNGVQWEPDGGGSSIPIKYAYSPTPIPSEKQSSIFKPASENTSAFQRAIDLGCYDWNEWSFSGCILKIAYYTLFQVPTFLLYITANFFNALISLVIQSSMYTHEFITGAWGIVRDISNIFFILILLYVAIKTVLNMGGHETKSTIASVIIMAILINFSLFFTKIVIDSSNILALVFYNKLDTKYENAQGSEAYRPEVATIKGGAKDTSGALYAKFDVTRLVNEDFLTKLQKNKVNNYVDFNTDSLPVGITLGILLIAALIMSFSAYAFFTAGIFFLGRIIELWLLMIFAPFAFMSFAVPKLSHTEYGWDNWSQKLISTAFMAPIFMFFLYLIFKLLENKTFFSSFLDTSKEAGWMAYLLGVLLPALIILGMLLKAKDLAKQGGGQFGEMAMGMAKVAMGLAAGAGAGLAASGLQATLGKYGKKLANDTGLANRELNGGWLDKKWAAGLRTAGQRAATGSFDIRKGAVGGVLKLASTATGLNLGAQSKVFMKEDGGYEADIHRRTEERKKRAEGLKEAMSSEETGALHALQEQERMVTLQNEAAIHKLDSEIEGLEGKAKMYARAASIDKSEEAQKLAKDANDKLIAAKGKKSAIKKGGYDDEKQRYRTDNGNITAAAYKEAIKTVSNKVTIQIDKERAHENAVTERTKAEQKLQNAARALVSASSDMGIGSKGYNKAKAEEAKARKELKKAEEQVSNSEKAKTDAAIKLERSQKLIEETQRKNEEAKQRGEKFQFGRSQSDFEDRLIPEAKHREKHAQDTAAWDYASSIENEWFSRFRKSEIHHSAHEIRMGAKPEAGHGGSHGDGHGFVDQLIVESAAHLVTGHDSGGHDSAAGDGHGTGH